MKKSGIIVEYNPFHNGHLYHLNQARKLTEPDVLIAVCTGNYNLRGDLSVINKFDKTKAALENGVDLVIELPYIYATQNANVFGTKAVELLDRFKIDHLVFGSETNNIDELKKYADLEIDVTKLKELMHEGLSYPKAYGLLSASLYPNDLLAVTYLKAIKNTQISPVSIQRTSDYLSKELDLISSATAIRKAIHEGIDVSQYVPYPIHESVFIDDLYPYLRKLLFTMNSEELREIFLVDEGIENMLRENALEYDDYEDFMNASISRRYTRSRLQRTCLQIMNHITKKEVAVLPELNYIRVLGFNQKGREVLHECKEELPIVTQFKNIPSGYKEIEWKTSLIYASLLKDPAAYLKQELKGPIIQK
ncbi:MAG: nucleotidyltransferase family protein [Erysipelotrichaceae bacterium]|nr:nucleotidyltransferase family protein [Erysipelotrichaceae bacterium]